MGTSLSNPTISPDAFLASQGQGAATAKPAVSPEDFLKKSAAPDYDEPGQLPLTKSADLDVSNLQPTAPGAPNGVPGMPAPPLPKGLSGGQPAPNFGPPTPPPSIGSELSSTAKAVPAIAKSIPAMAWDIAKQTFGTSLPDALNNTLGKYGPNPGGQAPTLLQHYDNVVSALQDSSLGKTLVEPLKNVPGADYLLSVINSLGRTGAGVGDFMTTPAGVLAGVGGAVLPQAGRIALSGGISAVNAPAAAEATKEFVQNPTPENLGKATGALFLMGAPEIIRALPELAKLPDESLKQWNARALQLLEEERAKGLASEQPVENPIVFPVNIAGKQWRVETAPGYTGDEVRGPNGELLHPSTEVPYVVVNPQGKIVTGGTGDVVAGFLRQKGANPAELRFGTSGTLAAASGAPLAPSAIVEPVGRTDVAEAPTRPTLPAVGETHQLPNGETLKVLDVAEPEGKDPVIKIEGTGGPAGDRVFTRPLGTFNTMIGANAPTPSSTPAAPPSAGVTQPEPLAPAATAAATASPSVAAPQEEGDVRRVTGSTPIPLSPEGIQQGQEMAANMAHPFDQVIAGPSERTQQTASFFGKPVINDAFDASHRGELEGQPADTVKDQVGDLLKNPEKTAPGVSPTSGVPGETQADFEKNLFQGVQKLQAQIQPNQRMLVVTHGADLQAINAWAKAGQPADFQFNRAAMAKEPYYSKTGQLFLFDQDGLKPVENNTEPGLYFTEHGSTKFNPVESKTSPESPVSTNAEKARASKTLVRYEEPGADLSAEKPHGLYFSYEEPGFKSPHAENFKEPTAYKAEATPQNLLEVTPQRVQSDRFRGITHDSAGPASAGVAALKKLTDQKEFDRILGLSKSDLVRELSTKFPGPDYGRYFDRTELREVYGAQLARSEGYDAIAQHDPDTKEFSEYVALAPSAIKKAPAPPVKGGGPAISAAVEPERVGVEKPSKIAQLLGLGKQAGATGLADAVYQKLKNGESLGNVTEFNKLAEQYFGSSRASGNWTPKDAFDAMEAGINKHLIDRGSDLLSMPYEQAMAELRGLMERITSQGVRTDEQIRAQQFSTPPTESFTAAKVANLTAADTMLEPSAGTGGLAVFPKSIGGRVYVNEISDRRRQMLEVVGFPNPTAHDGEIINALLDPGIRPTVVIMNPPFSAGIKKTGPAVNNNKYGFNHVDSALQRLAPNGRLIAILGGGRADDLDGGASLTSGPSGKWFSELAKRYNVRANVRISGKEYQKYGTAFATRIIVIDKNGPTPSRVAASPSWNSVVKGVAETLEEAYALLRDVAESRPAIEAAQANPASVGGAAQTQPRPIQGRVRNVPGRRAGGVLPSRPGTPGASALGGELGPGGPIGNGSGNDSNLPGEPTGVREPNAGPAEPAQAPTPGAATGSAQNGDLQRPLPNQPGNIIGGAGLTREQIIAAAAKRLAEKTGRTATQPATQKSYKAEIQVHENGEDKWYPNGQAFATADEAKAAGYNTFSNWTMAKDYRVVESDETPNYRFDNESYKSVAIPAKEEPAAAPQQASTPVDKTGRAPRAQSADKKYAAAVQLRRDFYTPGNIIWNDYWHNYNRILGYTEKPGGSFSVTEQHVNENGEPIEASPRTHSTPPSKGDRIVSRATVAPPSEATTTPKPQNVMSAAADEARQRLRDKLKRQGPDEPVRYNYEYRAEPDPIDAETLIDLSSIGAEHILNGVNNFQDWSSAFSNDVGDLVSEISRANKQSIPDILRQVYDLSRDVAGQFGGKAEAAPPPIPESLTKTPLDGMEAEGSPETVDPELAPKSEEEDSVAYVAYKPILPGPEHPGSIVETKTMSTIPLPPITYKPNLPESALQSGALSAVQLEAIALAGQANEEILPGGYRASFLCGDGCVGAGTRIYNPMTEEHTPIERLMEIGLPHVVLALTADGLVPHIASCPFLKGTAKLYKVTLASGRVISVTGEHRFLTPGGWLTIDRGLQPDDFLAIAEGGQSQDHNVWSSAPAVEPPSSPAAAISSAALLRIAEPISPPPPPLRIGLQSHRANGPEFSCDHYSRWDRILSIDFLRRDVYYDMYVPGPENYVAEGVINHNTGVGKNSIALGILWDNWRQGRKRLVFMSPKWDLIQDAMRDLDRMGAKEMLRGNEKKANGQYTTSSTSFVQPFNRFKYGDKINHEGILFSTYALARSESNKGDKRINQLEEYLRGDDDGEGAYIVYDESHVLKNAVVNGQGQKPSQIGKAIKDLMQRMPKLRSVSLSATAATDVVNLGYLDRLGIWGPGTPFPTGFGEFATQISGGKLAAMEMVARELKAQGKYLSRTLSFKGVTYSEQEHVLSSEQKDLYRTATKAWASVVQQAEAAIATTTNGGPRQRARFLANLGAAQQRFFGLLITALKTPTAVELANKALADGKSVVITLVNTNEAAQNREKNRAAEVGDDEDEIPDYDFGPKQLIIDLIREHFPTQQYRDDVDYNGNPIKVPVTMIDADGREIAVQNPDAVRQRDELIAQIDRDLHMPENPLDILINSLGGQSKVAELTSRKERFDSSVGKFIPRGDPSAARKDVNVFEMRNFQTGKKRVAILSAAADTGISLHSGLNVPNQQQRYHITLQVGWSADKAMQMFGRTHRTNQAHPPEYVLLVSDLGGEKRFISTIARRLGSLGALTKGQKNATSGTDLMDKVNFETEQGVQATTAFYDSLLKNAVVPGTSLRGMQILTDLRVLEGDPPTVPQKNRGNVTRLLNRLMALDPDVQNPTYNYFYDIFQAAVERAIQAGTLDTGVKTLPGDEFTVSKAQSISKDPKTGADTLYCPVEAKVRTNRISPQELQKRFANHESENARIIVNEQTKKLAFVYDAPPIVHASGTVEPASYVATAGKGRPEKVPNTRVERATEVKEWATEALAAAKGDLASEERTVEYNKNQAARFNDPWYKNRADESQKRVDELKKEVSEKEEIAKDPMGWARDEWGRQYEDAPSHTTDTHHLIGGAVMRFWNPIREASGLTNIYTAVDSKTGQRVVGVDIPPETIGSLLQRITGGASTVNTRQLILDVLRNNLTYSLEGNIQVRRGRVGREFVIQLQPANQEQAQNLRSLGVIYERGVVPVYYIPNATTGPMEQQQHNILSRVLDQYPIKPEGPAGGESARYSLGSEPLSIDKGPRAEYRNGILWVNPPMMEHIARAIGGPSKIGGVHLPPKLAQELPDRIGALGSVRRAIVDAAADHRSMTIVVQYPGQPLGKLKTSARHELFHATEMWAGPSRGTELLKDPIAQRAADKLADKGYERDNIPMIWSEIGAHLASGPIGWRDMGLNRDEAKALFKKYLTLLDPETVNNLRNVAPQLNQELYAARSINRSRAAIRAAIGEAPRGTQEGAGPGELRQDIRRNLSGEERPVGLREENAGERGAIDLTKLSQDLRDKFGNDAPRANYSGLGAAKRLFAPGRGLAEVEEANKPVFRSSIRAASSEAISSNLIANAVPAIVKALKGTRITWDDMRLYYTESRLRGLRERWRDFATQAESMTPEEFERAMAPEATGGVSPFIDLLSKIEGRAGLNQNLAQTAIALVDAKDWDTLRDLTAQSFSDAADHVATVTPPGDFEFLHDQVRNDPRVKEADSLYGDLIEKPLAENHALNEGVFSDALGPAGRYIPLIPFERNKIIAGPGRRLPFHKPRNIANAFATGLSPGYDIGMESFARRVSTAMRANDKASLIETMRDQNWFKPETAAFKTDEGLSMEGPDGITYRAVREEISPGRTIIKDRKVVHSPAKFGVMPLFMHRALFPILGRAPMDANEVIAMMRWANMLATKGPLELVYHSSGVLGALYANTPFLGKSGLDKALSIPLLKWFTIRGKLFSANPTLPENVEKLRKMAEAGAVPARSGKVTYSKTYASETGAKREFSFAPLLYGPKGIDARARILMYDIFEAAFPPEARTPENLHHFVNQLGNYTPEMQSVIERGLKHLGIGPFATAGMTRIVNGLNTIGGTGPQKGGTAESKIWWWLTSSAAIAVAAWIVAYKQLTGKYLWQDKRMKFMRIPVGGGNGYIDQFRHSKLGNQLWGTGSGVGYVNFAFLDNPLVDRGARATGIPGALETKVAGGNAGQMIEAAQKDALNSFAHPALGPAARAIFVGITGKETYLTDFRDRIGAWNPQLYPAIPEKTKQGLPSITARAWAAGKELNNFFADSADHLGQFTGFSNPPKYDIWGRPANTQNQGNWWLQTGTNLVFPNLVGRPSNPYARGTVLREQRSGTR